MAVVKPEHWFLGPDFTPRSPHFVRGNAVTPMIDGKGYMADLQRTVSACDQSLFIAGWRVTGEQILNPVKDGETLTGETFLEAVSEACKRNCGVKALLFNVPGTSMPGPFRMWHAKDNWAFCSALNAAGGDAVLDARFSRMPASAHHQKFIVATSSEPEHNTAYVGGIDVCLDRWDQAAHDNAPERQTDFVKAGEIETHTASQPGWHDVQVRVQGPAVSQIWQVFADRWNDERAPNNDPRLEEFRGRGPITASPPDCPDAGTQAIQVNQTLPAGVFPRDGGPGDNTVARAHERAIDLAEHYIYMEDQYVWPCSLVERLEEALKRGVHVLLVVARDYDAPGLSIIADRLRHQVVERLQEAGGDRLHVFHLEQPNGKQIYVHSKLMIVDDCYASVGSANFNARSLTNDTELQLGIVDEELVDIEIAGQRQQVCKFAHDLRCALWAEHLECRTEEIRDPIEAIARAWARAPSGPSRRAHPHRVQIGMLDVDPIAEYITTLITERLAIVPHIEVPAGISDRNTVKLLINTALMGPVSSLLIKFLEEMLNPSLAPALAGARQHLADGISALPGVGALTSPAQRGRGFDKLGHEINQRLRRGRLPRMVDWYDPGLLARIGVRTIISSTMGQYADQRLLQAASDRVSSDDELAHRYDYSKLDPANVDFDPAKTVEVRPDGAVWVDYVSDLGDGFEATYAMAYLMAPETLNVEGAGELRAGNVLIMGGDQAYPQATRQEYQNRLIDPYNWAYMTDRATRKLFSIPGNHDWYDGLGAFDGLFCSARDRISRGVGRKIGGWRCQQHRSYFAIKLPYDWWIWGADIQLDGYLDDSQRDYFDLISEQMDATHKVIICLAEPSWLHVKYENLHEINMLARKSGAKVCAVLAGDWHHYSRYHSPELGVHFITCGGGGAFAHATHALKNSLTLEWADVTEHPHRFADPADPATFNQMERRIVGTHDAVDFTEKEYTVSADERASTIGQHRRDRQDEGELKTKPYRSDAPKIYPSKSTSRLLGLYNLLFPFKHLRFSLMIGLTYLIYFWVAARLEEHQFIKYYLTNALTRDTNLTLVEFVYHVVYFCFLASIASLPFFIMIVGLWIGLVSYVDTHHFKTGFFAGIAKLVIGSIHFLAHLAAIAVLAIGLTVLIRHAATKYACWEMNCGALQAAQAKIEKQGSATQAATDRIRKLAAERRALDKKVQARAKKLRDPFTLLSPLLIIPFGGIIGGFIFGLYWVLTSSFAAMHTGDAFGALALRHYKHFLRMRFEPDQVTIYPIAIDKVPGQRGWRPPRQDDPQQTNNPQLVPKRDLAPHLIEAPIVIKPEDIV